MRKASAEFVGEVADDVTTRVPPELWKLHWPLMNTPVRRKVAVGLMEKLEDNFAWFPRYQAWLREHRPPTQIIWGPEDGYMPAGSARAYHRDLPDAELHLLTDAGHWLLETHFDAVLRWSATSSPDIMPDGRAVLRSRCDPAIA